MFLQSSAVEQTTLSEKLQTFVANLLLCQKIKRNDQK